MQDSLVKIDRLVQQARALQQVFFSLLEDREAELQHLRRQIVATYYADPNGFADNFEDEEVYQRFLHLFEEGVLEPLPKDLPPTPFDGTRRASRAPPNAVDEDSDEDEDA